jgi:hypothetical protein
MILNLNTRWTLVVSFMLLLLYLWGNSPQYPLYRRLGGPQSHLDITEKRKISLQCRKSNPNYSAVQPKS